MAGPRIKFRERPKKTGAKKKAKVNAQKKRLLAKGLEEEKLNKMTDREIREAQKMAYKRKRIKAKPKAKSKAKPKAK